jgi:hypothetical protein
MSTPIAPDMEPAYKPASVDQFTSLSWDELDAKISGDAKVLLALIRRDNWQRATDSISNDHLDLVAMARGYVVAELLDELVAAKLLRKLKHSYRDVNSAKLGMPAELRDKVRKQNAERQQRRRDRNKASSDGRRVTQDRHAASSGGRPVTLASRQEPSNLNTNVTRDVTPSHAYTRQDETRLEETEIGIETEIRKETETNPFGRPSFVAVLEQHRRLKASSQQEETKQ